WLHGNPHVEQGELLEALRHCNGNRLQALLLARDDFWMPLSRALAHLEVSLQEGNNAAAVDLFDKAHAHKVLMAFGRAYDRLPEADEQLTGEQRKFLRDAVDGLSDSGRMVCLRLAVFADMMKDRDWTPAELATVGGAKGVGVTLLEEKFGPHAPPACRPHREAVRRVLERFVPPYGTDLKGQAQPVDKLRSAARYGRAADFDELIGILDGGLKLLTPHTPDVPLEAGSQVSDSPSQVAPAYQLTHDFLVPTLREWLTSDLRRTRSGRAKLKLSERAEDWNQRPEPRRLPSLVEWLSIVLLARGHRRNAAEQRLMKAATRRIRLRAGGLGAAMLVLAGGFWVGFNVWRARDFRDNLQGARMSQVPVLAGEFTGIGFWARPLLEQAYKRANPDEGSGTERADATGQAHRTDLTDEQFQRLLNLGLVLGRENPDRLSPILDRLARIAPEDLTVIAPLLNRDSPATVKDLGQRLERALEDRPSEVLPLATLLAELDARDSRLDLAAPELARQLRDARPTHFPIWLRHLARAARQLRPELVKLWQSESAADSSQRAQLAEALALYGADDGPTLVEAFQDAEPEEFAVFLPPLERLGEDALPLFEQRIAEFQQAARPPMLTFDGSAPSAELVKALQDVQGHLTQIGGLALAVERSKLDALSERMFVEGYRPLAVRPHLGEQPSLVSVTWIRDRREFRLEVDRPTEDFRQAIDDHLADGFHLVDVSRSTAGDAMIDAEPVWTGVWVRSSADEPQVRVVFDPMPAPEPADGQADEPKSDEEQAGFVLTESLERKDADGQTRTTSLWLRLNPTEAERKRSATLIETAVAFAKSRPLESYGDLYPGYLQTDLRVLVNAVAEKSIVEFTGVWRSAPHESRESRQHMDESLEVFLQESQLRFDEGYLPLVIAPYPLPELAGTRYASIWQRALPDPAEAIRNARRLANLAIALAFRGHEQPLDDLLARTSPDRDPRTYAITRLAPAGFPMARLGEKLLAVKSSAEKYALLLALGECPRQSEPTSEAWQPVAQQIASWSETAPEATVRSAARWCARRLNLEPASLDDPKTRPLPGAQAVAQDERVVASDGEKSKPLPSGLDWYVNSQQHTMITLGPAEFRFGSPERELDREGTELQIWVKIPRRYSLATTPVTVQQFERFWNDPTVRARIPEDLHKSISIHRLSLSTITWHIECPQTGLERLLAMMYCEWLSERDGIPLGDRCYPEIWNYLKDPTAGGRLPAKQVETYGYLPRPNIVTRTGYRLPTEAEFEYACRAGTGESRHYGDSGALLAHFAWYRDNSGGKFQPVALKMPNDFGFFDLLGNSSNYCHDMYIVNNPPPDSDRREDHGTLANRTGNYSQRGGHFDSRAGELRSSNRTLSRHTNSHIAHGFRVAKTEPTKTEGADSAAD
ncbi:MAG: SUMF1/EgtB/PvdO family nonheme iron enzyme, partial [Pirellulaceae bacterium]|nr:SUMF1/EgtB/PvdO family nonheme iron enzyme [Pirellulaceae bacterium]